MTRIRFSLSIFVAVLVVFFVIFASNAWAREDAQALEDHMRTYRAKIEQKRDSALGTLLELTDEQAKVFRPLQKSYDKELKALAKKDRALLHDFARVHDKLDPDSASEIGQRFFDLERERLALQEKYLKQISDEVSPVTAVLFIQLQRRFETQVETERMKYSPLAE